MPRVTHVKKARKSIKGTDIKKGDSYYWWKFRFGSKQVSKTPPRRSQLTQSEHLGAIYDLEDDIAKMTVDDIMDGCLDDILSEIDNIRDTCESNLQNMPDSLQESPSGQILQEYIDNLESWHSDLESIDISNVDEEDCHQQAADEWDGMSEQDKKTDGVVLDMDDWVEERTQELIDEKKEEILSEIQSCTYPG